MLSMYIAGGCFVEIWCYLCLLLVSAVWGLDGTYVYRWYLPRGELHLELFEKQLMHQPNI